MRHTLYFIDLNQSPDSPGSQRVMAFNRHFKTHDVRTIARPQDFFSYFSLWCKMMFKHNATLWISMPPFRFWSLLLLPFPNKVLDIRDGWSVAMLNGYGGTRAPSHFKAWIAKSVEIMAFIMSKKVIVCTPGLQDYYQSFLPSFLCKKMILIPNGYTKSHTSKPKKIGDGETLHCVCAGKFSAYGIDKVKLVLKKLGERYKHKNIQLTLIGADRKENDWIFNYLEANGIKIELKLLPQVPANELDPLLAKMDLGIAIVRDPSYELGTKSFLYISHGIPIFNYFDSSNNFTQYFSGRLDDDLNTDLDNSIFSRDQQIQARSTSLSI